MFSNWVVGVVVNFTGNGAVTMARLASQTNIANAALQAQTGLISKQQLALIRSQERMEALRMSALRLGTAMSAAFAGVGVAAITDSVSQAAKLQQILLSIKNETGASNSQIGGFYNAAFSIANQNGMSVISSAEILRTVSRLTAGQFSTQQMLQTAPAVADFASKVHFNRPDVSVEGAAKAGIQLAHLFQAFSPKALNPLLEMSYRLSGVMAEDLNAAIRQMTYYVPAFKSLGIPVDQTVATMAFLDRMGFRNKVGTNVRAGVLESLGPLQLTQHAQAGKTALLEQMGLFKNGKFAWNNADGSLNYFGELGAIGTWAQGQLHKGTARSTIVQEMYGALGKQGGTIGSLFLGPQALSIMASLQKYLHDQNVGLAAATKNRDEGLGFQFGRAVGNFKAVMTELGYPWLTELTAFFKSIGDNLHGFQVWLHQHRGIEKIIGGAVATGTIGAAGLAVAGLGAMAGGVFGAGAGGIGGAVSALVTPGGWMMALRMLAPTFARLIPVVGWVVTGITAAVEAFKHASDISYLIGRIAGFFQYKIGPAFADGLASLSKWLVDAIGKFFHGAAWVVSHPWDARRVAGDALSHFATEKDNWLKGVYGAFEKGKAKEAPPQVNITVNVKGGGNPRKDGSVAGQSVLQELLKAGLIRNGALFGGYQVPATH